MYATGLKPVLNILTIIILFLLLSSCF